MTQETPGSQWRFIGNLLKIIGEIERLALTDPSREIDEHIKKALVYIEYNYTKPIAVVVIANHVCLERSYFSHHFKDKTGAPVLTSIVITWMYRWSFSWLHHTVSKLLHILSGTGIPFISAETLRAIPDILPQRSTVKD